MGTSAKDMRAAIKVPDLRILLREKVHISLDTFISFRRLVEGPNKASGPTPTTNPHHRMIQFTSRFSHHNCCFFWQWDLVCDRYWYQSTAMSIFMAGRVLGSMASGPLSDRSVQSERLSHYFLYYQQMYTF